jgi:hypothetical protein
MAFAEELRESLLRRLAESEAPGRARAVLLFIDLVEYSGEPGGPTLADVAREYEGDLPERVAARQARWAEAFGEAFKALHDHDCCPPEDCCGGPCAAHPCWELTT